MIKYEIWVKRPNEKRSSMDGFSRNKEIAEKAVTAFEKKGYYAFIKESDFTEIDEFVERLIRGKRERARKILQELEENS